MAQRKSESSTKKPSLTISREQVKKELQDRIDKGKELQTQSNNLVSIGGLDQSEFCLLTDSMSNNLASIEGLDQLRTEQDKWHEYNIEYLSRCFDIDSISQSYENRGIRLLSFGTRESPVEQIKRFQNRIGAQITELESILERLKLIPELNIPDTPNKLLQKQNTNDNNSVFIVHGHDESAKANVARLVEKLGMEAIILHEQPNQGRTIIEKLESNAASVGFAIVLLTPDDTIDSNGKKRARQNVIMELGYFCGLLGRNKVCVLYKENVEIPSDCLGLAYIPLDSNEGWHLKLAKEMKEAKLDVDLNKI